MKLIDNVNSRLGDDLKASIRKGSKLSVAASSFSIYAYEELKKELGNIDELRFIFSSPTFIEENLKKYSRLFYIPHIYKECELGKLWACSRNFPDEELGSMTAGCLKLCL